MSSLTRAGVESELIDRCGGLMTKVGRDGTTCDGTNPNLNDPIRRGLRTLGLDTADPIIVADGDLAGVNGWNIEKLLDAAELRATESIWGNWGEVAEKIDLGSKELQQLADRIERRIDHLVLRLRQPYGPNTGAPVVGSIRHGRYTPNDQPVLAPPGGLYGYGERAPWDDRGSFSP